MSLHTVILETFTDDEFGTVGLRPVGARSGFFAVTTGVLMAHDLLEHCNGVENIGGEHGIDDELEALGALWAVRGQFDDLNRNGNVSRWAADENVASEVVRLFVEFYHGAYVDLSAPRTRPCDLDQGFRDVLEHAKQDYPDELSDDNTREVRALWRKFRSVAFARMRIGYRKTLRRFGSAQRANRLFWTIVDAVDPHAQLPGEEGSQFKLVYGFDKYGAFATCHEHYPEDDYDSED